MKYAAYRITKSKFEPANKIESVFPFDNIEDAEAHVEKWKSEDTPGGKAYFVKELNDEDNRLIN